MEIIRLGRTMMRNPELEKWVIIFKELIIIIIINRINNIIVARGWSRYKSDLFRFCFQENRARKFIIIQTRVASIKQFWT